MNRSFAFLCVSLMAALATACSGAAPTATSAPPTATTASATATTAPTATSVAPTATTVPAYLKVTANAKLGSDILTDANGRTIYARDGDTPTTPTCSGTCLNNWPVFTPPSATTLTIALGVGIGAKVEVFARADGTKQVEVNGSPMYYYVGDTASGDAKGAGLAGQWYTRKPDGSKNPAVPPPTPTAAAPTATTASTGTVKTSSIVDFGVETFSIAAGTTVTWTNVGDSAHDLKFASLSADSGTLNNGQKFSLAFPKAGTYDYICVFHPTMTGKVTVTG